MVATHAQQLVSYLSMVSVVLTSATWCPDAELIPNATKELNIRSDGRLDYVGISDGLIVLGADLYEGNRTGLWFFDTKGYQLTRNIFAAPALAHRCFMKLTVAVDADTVVTSCGESIWILNRSGDLLAITRPDPQHHEVEISHIAMDDTVLVAAASGSRPSVYVFDKMSDDQQFVRFEVEIKGYFATDLSIAVDNGKLCVGARVWRGLHERLAHRIVHVYDMSGHRLVALTRSAVKSFGESLAIDDGKIVVGAPDHNLYNGTGDVYVFDTTGNELSHFTEPSHSRNERSFGSSVDIDDGMIVVGSSCCAYAFDAATGRKLFFRDLDDIANSSYCKSKAPNFSSYRVAVDSGVIVAGAYIFDTTRTHQHQEQIHNNQFLNFTLLV